MRKIIIIGCLSLSNSYSDQWQDLVNNGSSSRQNSVRSSQTQTVDASDTQVIRQPVYAFVYHSLAKKEGDQVVITGSVVNLRSVPSSRNNDPVSTAKAGDKFQYVSKTGNWYKFILEGSTEDTGTTDTKNIVIIKSNYTVKSGDSLSAIASKSYRDQSNAPHRLWPLIYVASNLESNSLRVGQKLQVPELPSEKEAQQETIKEIINDSFQIMRQMKENSQTQKAQKLLEFIEGSFSDMVKRLYPDFHEEFVEFLAVLASEGQKEYAQRELNELQSNIRQAASLEELVQQADRYLAKKQSLQRYADGEFETQLNQTDQQIAQSFHRLSESQLTEITGLVDSVVRETNKRQHFYIRPGISAEDAQQYQPKSEEEIKELRKEAQFEIFSAKYNFSKFESHPLLKDSATEVQNKLSEQRIRLKAPEPQTHGVAQRHAEHTELLTAYVHKSLIRIERNIVIIKSARANIRQTPDTSKSPYFTATTNMAFELVAEEGEDWVKIKAPNPTRSSITIQNSHFKKWLEVASRFHKGKYDNLPALKDIYGNNIDISNVIRAIIMQESAGVHKYRNGNIVVGDNGASKDIGFCQLNDWAQQKARINVEETLEIVSKRSVTHSGLPFVTEQEYNLPLLTSAMYYNVSEAKAKTNMKPDFSNPMQNLHLSAKILGDILNLDYPNTANDEEKLVKSLSGYNHGPYSDDYDIPWKTFVSRVHPKNGNQGEMSGVHYGIRMKMFLGLELEPFEIDWYMKRYGYTTLSRLYSVDYKNLYSWAHFE
jgi:LysM repeat protein/HEPN domain-containing protein